MSASARGRVAVLLVCVLSLCGLGAAESLTGSAYGLPVAAAPAAAATPVFQQANAREITSGTVNSVAFTNANTAGNLIVVYAVWGNTGSVTLSDTAGNTYVSVQAATTWGRTSSWRAQVFYAKNVAGGANTVTGTFSSSVSGSFGGIYVHEYAGMDKVSPLDVVKSAKGTGTALSSGAAVTTNANDLIFGAGATAGAITSAGAAYSVRSTVSGNWTMDRNVTTTGSYAATATATSARWVMQLVAFKAQAGTDSTPPSTVLTAPTSGSTVSGTIAVSATATDDVAVADVDFLLDGVSMGVDTTAPYSVQWNTTTTSNGLHSLSARARDTSGNFGVTSGVVSVMVSNSAPPPPPSGMVAAWNFDENGGTTAADVTSNGNTATLVNGASWVTGKNGSGIKLNGSNQYLSVPSSPSINISGNALAFSAWINPVSSSGDRVVFAKFYNATMSSPYYQYGLEVRGTSNTPVFLIGTSGGIREAPMGAGLTAGVWAHRAVVFNGSLVQFYTNGTLTSSVALATSITARTSALYLGADVSPGQFLNGSLDDVRLYATTLTAAQVQSDMNTPVVGSVDPGAPTVSITSPANDAQVSGMTTVQADADDDVGVAGVQFFVDGSALGVEDTTTPYAATWDTRAFPNGAHTVTARARDASGHTTVSRPVNVNVVNGDYFQNEILATGLDLPTAMKFLPDGRMLVAELQGRIKVFPPPYTTADPGLFLQISTGASGVQQGIFDFALDPGFATNHYYYVFFTAPDGHDQLSRFTANAAVTGTVAGSELVLYRDPDVAHAEHHGGAINFANDGKLLLTTGEHFDSALSQDLSSPRGKILRFNPDGTVPTDNPFYDGTGPHYDAIWALGLRNPYRAYYDAPTGRLFIGDVGGNDPPTSQEEVDLGVRGANYGWPNYEGACTGSCTSPLYSYAHNGRDASVTGGFVYHGTQFPVGMRGNYFFADYAQNWIRRMTFDANGAMTGVFNFEPADGTLDGPTGDIVYLTEGPDGALYYIDLGYSDVTGTFGVSKVRRIRYQQSNQAPIAVAGATPTSGPVPLAVSFSSAGSNDPEGQPITYVWDFGDGTTSPAANPTHTYAAAGVYTVRLTVSDGANSTFAPPITVTVGSPPQATIVGPADGSTFRAGQVISFTGEGTDPDDGTLPASAFGWSIDFLHDGHVHPVQTLVGVKGGSFTIPTSGHDFSGNTRYRISLTVTDSNGLTDTESVVVWPEKVNLTFSTTPAAGLTLYLDGIAKTAPFTYDTLIGFAHTIEARDQTVGGNNYTFSAWSDGGARTHTVTVPATAQSYTATYTATPAAPPGLAAAWGFNEVSGATATDASGNNNTATLLNGLGRVAGKYGNGLSFDGTNDYLTAANSTSLNVSGTALTLSMWLKPAGGSGDQVLVGKHWNTGMTSPYYQYGLELQSGGTRPVFMVGTTGGVLAATMGSTLPTTQWSHLAVTFDGTTVRFYVNGTLVGSQGLGASITARANPLRIGADANTSQFYKGLLDDVRIYTRTQSVADIQADMNTGL
jgi:glucose/arabinose dehydrogenase/PKD repeat protein